MKILFYLGHPAHFHLFKESIKILKSRSHDIVIVIKKKDILEDLLNYEKYEYYNVYPFDRNEGIWSHIKSIIIRDIEVFKIAFDKKPDIMIGTSAEITHVGKILLIPSIVVNEDDADQVPLFANFSYPFANNILVPINCRVGRWAKKTIFYNGFHELAYLHPQYFKPDKSKIQELFQNNKPYYLLRFAKLNAHHDKGKTGITRSLAYEIINILNKEGNVYISCEGDFESELEKYRINIHPSQMLHALAFASIYIGDSQTMAAEAAVLGTPSLRFNDFVGKLTYLEELEYNYGLTYGVKTSEPEKLISKLKEMLSLPELKNEWQSRRQKLLKEKINVTNYFVWIIENYLLNQRLTK